MGYDLGDSLSFLLTVYNFGLRYHRFGNEELVLIEVHTPMISTMNDFGMNSDKCLFNDDFEMFEINNINVLAILKMKFLPLIFRSLQVGIRALV